jgi:hypothetical protein
MPVQTGTNRITDASNVGEKLSFHDMTGVWTIGSSGLTHAKAAKIP